MQNDNAKIHEAVKNIKHRRPLQKVLIKGKNGLTAKTRRANIAEYFKETSMKINNQQQSYHRHE